MPTGPTGDAAAAAPEPPEDVISSDRVEGTPVFDRAGGRLGTIRSLVIGKRTGRVHYAVMDFGGVLGLGDRHHPLPWGALRYDTALGGYAVDLDRAQLEAAPSHAPGEAPYADSAFAEAMSGFYGLLFSAPLPRV